MRYGRRRYYDLFSHLYDSFVAIHSRRDEQNTRFFLVDCAQLERVTKPRILDICCGTGSVILTFAQKYPESTSVGLDFSHGMLHKAKEKDSTQIVSFLEGEARMDALKEMKRVVKPGGIVMIMEHEVPTHPLIKFLFNIRMSIVGSTGT